MKVWANHGSQWMTVPTEHATIKNKLSPGVYGIVETRNGLILREEKPFELPKKIYGSTNTIVKKMINTYEQKTGSLGILLNGLKGSGKTMMGKKLSVELNEKAVPTILVNQSYDANEFARFVSDIPHGVLFFFDEIDKVFKDEEQLPLLTLLSGVYDNHHIFLFTSNDITKINENFKNRPERIRYSINFKGMSPTAIKDYCEDCLTDKTQINNILCVSCAFDPFNFDMLQALVSEMNLYNETPSKALELLNIRPPTSPPVYEYTKFVHKGQNCLDDKMYATLSGPPVLLNPLGFGFYVGSKEDKEKGRHSEYAHFDQEKHLKNFDPVNGVFEYDNGESQLTVSKRTYITQNFSHISDQQWRCPYNPSY